VQAPECSAPSTKQAGGDNMHSLCKCVSAKGFPGAGAECAGAAHALLEGQLRVAVNPADRQAPRQAQHRGKQAKESVLGNPQRLRAPAPSTTQC
jgi:hypothetical protein